jgi:GH15 family glucan-1,4-alpha-glucosidase
VRVGNAAFSQRQLDVYGHVLEAASTYRRLRPFGGSLQGFLCQTASRAARLWREPDHGIWERRDDPRHWTSSKLQCWVGLDRALALAPELGAGADTATWRAERDAIRGWLEKAWDEERGVFPSVPAGEEIDASSLLFVLSGFLPAGELRARRLVEAVDRELAESGLVRRWSGSGDGAFLLCTFWLAQAAAMVGDLDRAHELLERAAGCANDVGLLPEEADPESGAGLGNTPLAISHAGMVRAVTAIEDVERAGRAGARAAAPLARLRRA